MSKHETIVQYVKIAIAVGLFGLQIMQVLVLLSILKEIT